MCSNKNQDVVSLLLKEYDYYMQRISVCQDVAKSIVLRSLATIIVVGVGTWKWITATKATSVYHGIGCIVVTGIILLAVLVYSVFSMYVTWLDRRMCELKLNYIRKWFFQGRDDSFDFRKYLKILDECRKPAWKEFARIRRGKRLGNPWFFNSISIVLFAIVCLVVVIIFILTETF